ncbi:uncharacterized protein LOC111071629 [Drosophila obscura]|uniref:uncharacterized protein LOC111071629 n=1 Tax=Drosophila obscura TaxID=7282 RepID=UPI001BB2A54C|nr:uncharacterized protein LOC111071629 [Drosophila obscura]
MGRAKPIKRRFPRRSPPIEMELITVEEMAELLHSCSLKSAREEAEKKRQPYVEVNNDDHRFGEWKLPEGTKSSMERAKEIVRALEKCPYPSYIQPPRPRFRHNPLSNLKFVPFSSERRIFDDVKEETKEITRAAQERAAGIEPLCEGAVGYDLEYFEASMMIQMYKIDRPWVRRAHYPFNPVCLAPKFNENCMSGKNRLPSKPSKPSKLLQGTRMIRSRRYAARNVDTGPILVSRYESPANQEHMNIQTLEAYCGEYDELDQVLEGLHLDTHDDDVEDLRMQWKCIEGESSAQHHHPPSFASDGTAPPSGDED